MTQSKGTMSRVGTGNEIPKMGLRALNLEAGLHAFLSNGGMRASGGKGTGIIVVRDDEGRVFKVELTQVEGQP